MRNPTIILMCVATFLASCQESFDKRLQREAQNFTEEKCPQEPEPGTRLDSTTYDPQTHVYTRWYSLAAQNETIVRANSPLLRRALVKELAGDVDFKAVKAKGVTFRYVYRSQASGDVIYETKIVASEYGK